VAGRDNIEAILALRKLTRAIGAPLRAQLTEYLTTLTPVLRPESVFGKLVQGGQKEWFVKSDQALKELKALYDAVAPSSPFGLRTELTPPFDLAGLALDLTPAEYTHVVQSGAAGRTITVRSPLEWTLAYRGFSPPAFKQLLTSTMRPASELQRFLVAYLALTVVTRMQPGVVSLLGALRFRLSTVRHPDFGELPIMRISADVTTERPSDAVILQSAELTGMDAFEEVVDIEQIQQLRDPFREQLLNIAREHTPQLVP